MSENLKIAEYINTNAAQLRELANNIKDLAVLIAIAKNPNTPPDLLIELAYYKKWFNEIGNNPALELILIESPGLIEDIYYKIIFDDYTGDYYIYNYKYFPLQTWFLELGLNHPNFEIRAVVAAESENTPLSYLEKLAQDENSYVRASVAKNINTSVSLLEKLAEDENHLVKEAVAENTNSPISVLEKLAQDENSYVRVLVAANQNTPSNLLNKLAENEDNNVKDALASNQNTPSFVLEKLAENQNKDIRASVAENRNTPISVLEQLAENEDNNVKNALANNPNIPSFV